MRSDIGLQTEQSHFVRLCEECYPLCPIGTLPLYYTLAEVQEEAQRDEYQSAAGLLTWGIKSVTYLFILELLFSNLPVWDVLQYNGL